MKSSWEAEHWGYVRVTLNSKGEAGGMGRDPEQWMARRKEGGMDKVKNMQKWASKEAQGLEVDLAIFPRARHPLVLHSSQNMETNASLPY